MASKPKTEKVVSDKQLAAKVRRCLRSKVLGKRHYERADNLLREIATEIEPGQAITLGDGKKVVLIDRYAGKDIVWQPCAARKWELEERAV